MGSYQAHRHPATAERGAAAKRPNVRQTSPSRPSRQDQDPDSELIPTALALLALLTLTQNYARGTRAALGSHPLRDSPHSRNFCVPGVQYCRKRRRTIFSYTRTISPLRHTAVAALLPVTEPERATRREPSSLQQQDLRRWRISVARHRARSPTDALKPNPAPPIRINDHVRVILDDHIRAYRASLGIESLCCNPAPWNRLLSCRRFRRCFRSFA